MTNPYINSNLKSDSFVGGVDGAINKMAKELPFVPDSFNAAGFLKGVLVGAGVAYLLTNEKAQQALFKAIVKAGNLLECGVEELKERFEDAKAEFNAQK